GVVLEPAGEILAEFLEAHRSLLHALLAQREQAVAGDPIHPGSKAAIPAEARETRDDPNENLLGRVLRVLGVPQEAQRHAVYLRVHGANHGLQRVAVSRLRPGDLELETRVASSGRSLIHDVQECA